PTRAPRRWRSASERSSGPPASSGSAPERASPGTATRSRSGPRRSSRPGAWSPSRAATPDRAAQVGQTVVMAMSTGTDPFPGGDAEPAQGSPGVGATPWHHDLVVWADGALREPQDPVL